MKLNYNKAEFTAAYGKFSQIPPPERIEIAFAGHSNVGKSTLINKLFNRKNLARVSSVPGKTATINFFGLENIYSLTCLVTAMQRSQSLKKSAGQDL